VFLIRIKGEALIFFCVLKKDTNGDAALAAELKERVARDLGKALAPKRNCVRERRLITERRPTKVCGISFEAFQVATYGPRTME